MEENRRSFGFPWREKKKKIVGETDAFARVNIFQYASALRGIWKNN
jgi:hypothetical protein